MFITVGEAKIFATAFGSPAAPAILGIGGWIGSWELWTEPLALLSDTWRTIAFDHRGSGATVAPVETITFDQLIEDVFIVLDAYGVERCVLAAESMGAMVALGAALRQPQRVAGLVIVDGMDFRGPPAEPDLFLAGLRSDYGRTLDRFVDDCVPEPGSDPIRRWGHQIVSRAAPEAAIALMEVARAADLRADLPRISLPTLVIHGDADVIAPLAGARWLAQTLPQARLTILKGAGHVPTLTRPREIVEAIRAMFEG